MHQPTAGDFYYFRNFFVALFNIENLDCLKIMGLFSPAVVYKLTFARKYIAQQLQRTISVSNALHENTKQRKLVYYSTGFLKETNGPYVQDNIVSKKLKDFSRNVTALSSSLVFSYENVTKYLARYLKSYQLLVLYMGMLLLTFRCSLIMVNAVIFEQNYYSSNTNSEIVSPQKSSRNVLRSDNSAM
jgi:hypothetical protein